MTKRIVVSMVLALGMLVGVVATAQAEGGVKLMDSGANIHNQASLQRGAKLFMADCSGCHSLHFMRYSRIAQDLGLTKQEVMSKLDFTGGGYQEPIVSAMTPQVAKLAFGKVPPDLSLIVDQKGADWVYTYLNSFYFDPASATGWNNTVFPHVAMPNVLAAFQGLQVPVYGKAEGGAPPPVVGLKLKQPGSMTPAQFHAATRDITAFLEYVSDPSALVRHSMAPWVLIYLVVLAFLLWLVKHEYWKDVH